MSLSKCLLTSIAIKEELDNLFRKKVKLSNSTYKNKGVNYTEPFPSVSATTLSITTFSIKALAYY
jgi:hypothetical protein